MKTIDRFQYNTALTKNFWCFNCKREFSKLCLEQLDVKCSNCVSVFCEDIVSRDNDPRKFEPFTARPNIQSYSVKR